MGNNRISDWLPDSPFRKPDWRWKRACWLMERGKRVSRRLDDDWVRRAKEFVKRQRAASPTTARSSGTSEAALQEALFLAAEAPDHDRWKVEALLLTRQPFDAVASACRLDIETVEAYHALHFDVRPRLGATDWIMARVIGTCWAEGFATLPLGALWKYAAFSGGPGVLEVVIAVTTGKPLPAWLRNSFIKNPNYEEARLRLKAKLTVAALTAGPTEDITPLLQMHSRALALEDRTVRTRDKPEGLLPVMQGFLKSVVSGKRTRRKASALRTTLSETTRTLKKRAKSYKRLPLTSLLMDLN